MKCGLLVQPPRAAALRGDDGGAGAGAGAVRGCGGCGECGGCGRCDPRGGGSVRGLGADACGRSRCDGAPGGGGNSGRPAAAAAAAAAALAEEALAVFSPGKSGRLHGVLRLCLSSTRGSPSA